MANVTFTDTGTSVFMYLSDLDNQYLAYNAFRVRILSNKLYILNNTDNNSIGVFTYDEILGPTGADLLEKAENIANMLFKYSSGSGASGNDTELLGAYDFANGASFVRKMVFDSDGNFVSKQDLDLNGDPYVYGSLDTEASLLNSIKGFLQNISGYASKDYELIALVDWDGGSGFTPFVRCYTLNDGDYGGVYADFLLDGTPYVVAGFVLDENTILTQIWNNTTEINTGIGLITSDGTSATNIPKDTYAPFTQDLALNAVFKTLIGQVGLGTTNKTIAGLIEDLRTKLNDLATESTLAAFKTANHTDLLSVVANQKDFDYLVNDGQVSGIAQKLISGYGTVNSANASPVASWLTGGAQYYGFSLATNKTLTIVSSSASDAAAGTGIRTVLLQGITDVGGVWQTTSEILTLNGTSTVTTANQYIRVNRLIGLTAGTNQQAVGTITLYDTVIANVMQQIAVGEGQSQGVLYSIADDRKAFLVGYGISNGAGDSTLFRFRKRLNPLSNGAIINSTFHRINAGALQPTIRYILISQGKCDFWVDGLASSATDTIYCQCNIYEKTV